MKYSKRLDARRGDEPSAAERLEARKRQGTQTTERLYKEGPWLPYQMCGYMAIVDLVSPRRYNPSNQGLSHKHSFK